MEVEEEEEEPQRDSKYCCTSLPDSSRVNRLRVGVGRCGALSSGL